MVEDLRLWVQREDVFGIKNKQEKSNVRRAF